MAPPPRILVPVCFPMCPCHIPCVPCPLSLLPLHPVSGLYVVPLPPFICPLSPVIPFPPQSTAPCCFFSFVSVVSPVPLDNMPPPVTPVFPLSPCVHSPPVSLSPYVRCPSSLHVPSCVIVLPLLDLLLFPIRSLPPLQILSYLCIYLSI